MLSPNRSPEATSSKKDHGADRDGNLAALAEPAQFRMVLVAFLAAGIGFLAGLIAYVLYHLIGLFTNIVFYHRFVFAFTSPRNNHLGPWVIFMPVLGGLAVGFMAKYGSSKIKTGQKNSWVSSGSGSLPSE